MGKRENNLPQIGEMVSHQVMARFRFSDPSPVQFFLNRGS